MVIAGIDYSLTCPGICIYDSHDGVFNFDNAHFYFRSNLQRFDNFTENRIRGENHGSWKTEIDRYDDISNWALNIMTKHVVDKVILEGYSFGSTGRVFNIAENTAILKYNLWDAEIDFEVVPPTVIKKFATGKGNANKELMYESFIKENSHVDLRAWLTPRSANVISPVGDIVDSYFIAKYGLSLV